MLCDLSEKHRHVRIGSKAALSVALGLLCLACNDSTEARQPSVSASAITSAPSVPLRAEKREAHRAKIESLKQRAQSAVEGPDKEAILRQIDEEMKGYVSTREGHLEPLAVETPDPASDAATAQRTSLLAKMAAFDMSKPEDVAKWAQIKHKELGR